MSSLKARQKSSHVAAACARAWRVWWAAKAASGNMIAHSLSPSSLHGQFCLPSRHPGRPLVVRMQRMDSSIASRVHFNMKRATISGLLVAILLHLTGCQVIQSGSATAEPAAAGQETSVVAGAESVQVQTTPFVLPAATALPIVAPFAESANAISSPEEAAVAALVASNLTPTRLVIADARMDLPVVPMGWQTTRINGDRTTRWVLPEGAAGWHVESARPGEGGNLVISGRQLGGDVFAPIAQNAVQVGQEAVLVDNAGNEYRYRVSEVSAPLAIQGDAEAEMQAEEYLAQTDAPTLTLLTGWPDFTTTHRIFVVATLQ